MVDRRTVALLALLGVVVLALAVLQFGLWLPLVGTGAYDTGTVTVTDPGGEPLGTVTVRIADTPEKRTVGLSRTESLGPEEGMFFVHGNDGPHSYVMRSMAFPLDIVFVAENGTVTAIHHAEPEGPFTPSALHERYTGEGRYVLEVRRGWTNESGVAVGDRVVGPEGVGPTPPAGADDRPTVTALAADGTVRGTVAVRIADTPSERYTGLSETDALGRDEGMLFVYDDERERSFVMRNMSFPLDIVFVDAEGTVTAIHHAAVPPPGTEESGLERYTGTAQYVLEVDRGWTNDTGLAMGDTIRVPDGV